MIAETRNNFSEVPNQEFPKDTSKTVRKLVFLTIGAIAIIAIIVAWRFFSVGSSGRAEVAVWFDIPDTVTIGSETEFTVVYENRESQTVDDLNLELSFPGGFQFIAATPEPFDASGRQFRLPPLPPNSSGTVKMSGIFTGTSQTAQNLNARLLYRIEGVSSQFSTSVSATVQLQAANFDLRLTGPTEHINGQKIEYTISFQNISDSTVNQLFVKLSPPTGFAYEQDESNAENGLYEVNMLSAGERFELKVAGSLSGQVGDRKIMRAELVTPTSEGEDTLQGRAVLTTKIIQSDLFIEHRLKNASLNISPGQELEYAVTYRNQGDRGLRNITVTLQFEDSFFDLASLRTESGALVGSSVIWNASGAARLEVVNPGASGEFAVRIKARSDLAARKIINPSGATRVFARSQEFPQDIPGNQETVKVKSELTPQAQLFHLSGPQPPEPNQTSEYRVVLSLANSYNKVENIFWQGFLSTPFAEFINGSEQPESSASDITYNQSSGRISWSPDALEPFTDSAISFVIRVTPSIADSGDRVTILRSTELTGKDTFIGKTITIPSPPNLQTLTVE